MLITVGKYFLVNRKSWDKVGFEPATSGLQTHRSTN